MEYSRLFGANVKMNQLATGTLGKAISLLEVIAMSAKPLRFTDILIITGQPRGSLHRQLSHLLVEGLIEQKADQTYIAGLRLLKFASQAWSQNDLRSIAAPYLQELYAVTEESIHLAVLRGSEVIYLDKLDARQSVRMYSQIGKSSPVYCTGVGKAVLSLLSPEELAQLASTLDYKSFTKNTIQTPDQLVQAVEHVRISGFCFDLEEHEEGIHCVAAPISMNDHNVRAAISLTGPAYRLSKKDLAHWSSAVCETARNITVALNAGLPPA